MLPIPNGIPNNAQVKKETSCCRTKLRQEVLYITRKYTKIEHLSDIIKKQKATEKNNRAKAESYSLTKK